MGTRQSKVGFLVKRSPALALSKRHCAHVNITEFHKNPIIAQINKVQRKQQMDVCPLIWSQNVEIYILHMFV